MDLAEPILDVRGAGILLFIKRRRSARNADMESQEGLDGMPGRKRTKASGSLRKRKNDGLLVRTFVRAVLFRFIMDPLL